MSYMAVVCICTVMALPTLADGLGISLLPPSMEGHTEYVSQAAPHLSHTNESPDALNPSAVDAELWQLAMQYSTGSQLLGKRVRRAVPTSNGGGVIWLGCSINGWYPVDVSDFYEDSNASLKTAALWRCVYDDVRVGEEDLEEHEALEGIAAFKKHRSQKRKDNISRRASRDGGRNEAKTTLSGDGFALDGNVGPEGWRMNGSEQNSKQSFKGLASHFFASCMHFQVTVYGMMALAAAHLARKNVSLDAPKPFAVDIELWLFAVLYVMSMVYRKGFSNASPGSTPASASARPARQECSICMDREAQCAMIPCGHLCMCESCAVDAALNIHDCPICRGRVHKKVRIYF